MVFFKYTLLVALLSVVHSSSGSFSLKLSLPPLSSSVPTIVEKPNNQAQQVIGIQKCSLHKFIVRSPGDLAQLAGCESLQGDILVTDFKHPLLNFGGLLKEVHGSIIVENSPDLVRLESPELQLISKAFKLHKLTSLSLVLAPNLESVNDLDWQVLPILSNVQISPHVGNILKITISDTSLMGFAGFNTHALDTLDINNNRFLDSIKCNVIFVKEKLHIAANSKDLSVSLPNLTVANNISIHDVSLINLADLRLVNNSMSIIQNNLRLLEMPHLTKIGGTLSFLKNEALSTISMPELSEIGGGLMILNNTRLDKINFLPRLTMIGGALEMAGNLKEAKLPSLKLVKGSALIRSFVSLFDCKKWSQSDIRTIVRGGKIECGIGNEKPISLGTSTGNQDSSSWSGYGNRTSSILSTSGASTYTWLSSCGKWGVVLTVVYCLVVKQLIM